MCFVGRLRLNIVESSFKLIHLHPVYLLSSNAKKCEWKERTSGNGVSQVCTECVLGPPNPDTLLCDYTEPMDSSTTIPYFELFPASMSGGGGAESMESSVSCFHGSTAVKVPGGGQRVMNSLKEGDKVMVITEEGDVKVDRVVLMAHSNSRQVANFTVVSVGDRKLKVSGEHYVLLGSPSAIPTVRHVRADQVAVNDLVVTSSGALQKVRSVQQTVERGVYSPVTHSGHLLTEDLLTSVYAADVPLLTDPRLMHVLMWPLRVAGRAPLAQWWDNEEGRPLVVSALQSVWLSTVASLG